MAVSAEDWEKQTNEFVKFCEDKKCTTQRDVHATLTRFLNKNYGGKAPKWKLKAIADDFTESVCLKMKIAV